MTKAGIVILMAAVVLLVVSVVGILKAPTSSPTPIGGYLIKITPAEFFSGDLKRLEYHVDFRACQPGGSGRGKAYPRGDG